MSTDANVEVRSDEIQIDAAVVAAGLGIELSAVCNPGQLTSRCEPGVGEDQDHLRMTFFYPVKRFRVTVDEEDASSAGRASTSTTGICRLTCAGRRLDAVDLGQPEHRANSLFRPTSKKPIAAHIASSFRRVSRSYRQWVDVDVAARMLLENCNGALLLLDCPCPHP
jgi:hypothetical protein